MSIFLIARGNQYNVPRHKVSERRNYHLAPSETHTVSQNLTGFGGISDFTSITDCFGNGTFFSITILFAIRHSNAAIAAQSISLFHSMRISLFAFICSAFGLFLPTFFAGRYGAFLLKISSRSLLSGKHLINQIYKKYFYFL